MYILIINLITNSVKRFLIPVLCVCFISVLTLGVYASYQWYTLSNELKDIESEKEVLKVNTTQLQEEIELIQQGSSLEGVEADTETRTVYLYYYNLNADKEIAEYIPCSEDAVLPVEREIPLTISPIRDTLDLLLKGILTDEEIVDSYQTEFPNELFEISSINLKEGVLYIDFTDAPDFVNGGSCRTGLLEAQIRKTAMQFPQVESVEYVDELIFQP